ncbi:MAG: MFS transporter [Deltaproteobacteria bacterium]|nr:MFS transporter [Deltaproteobacteria bacterium]
MFDAVRQRFSNARDRLPRLYWTLWWGTLINRAGGFVGPLLTFYLTGERGLSLSLAGVIVALYGVGQVGASLVGGVLADRLGRRATLLLSLGGGAASMLALGFARAPSAIAVLVVVQGFTGELYRPAVAALIADIVPPVDRMLAYGLQYWAVNLGFSAAPVIAGLLARASFTLVFIGDAITTLVYGSIVLARVPETRPAAPPPGTATVRLADVLSDRVFMTLVGIAFLTALVPFQSSFALSAYMAGQGYSAAEYGAVLAVNGVLIILFQPILIGPLTRRDPSRVLAASALIMGVGFALHDVAIVLALHLAAVAVWSIGEIFATSVFGTLVAACAPAEARGRYQGVFSMSWGAASAIGPIAGARVLEDLGSHALWLGCAGVGAISAALYVITGPARRERVARANAS